VSLPPGWQKLPGGDAGVTFGGPPALGYRPIVAIAHEPFRPATPAGFADGIDELRRAQLREYEGFRLVREWVADVDGRPTHLVTFRWLHAVGELTQVLALVVVEPGLALQADGVCLTALESDHLPDIESLVLSIGFAG